MNNCYLKHHFLNARVVFNHLKVDSNNFSKLVVAFQYQTLTSIAGKRVLTEKYYEIKDHIGNIRLVLWDKKYRVNNNSYAAIPLEVNNYYPFGALMSENSWKYAGILEADGVNDASPYYYDPYTYAFQQMQRDNGTKSGNDIPGYATLFRGYDTEGGRWNQIDPKWRELPSESPYCGMGFSYNIILCNSFFLF